MPTRRQVLLGAAGLGLCGSGADALAVEPRSLDLTRHDAPIPGLDRALDGLRVAHVTDLHLRDVHAAARRCAEAIAAEQPEVVVLTGDIVASQRALAELPAWLEGCRGSLATIAIPGNWERWGKLERPEIERAYDQAQARYLVNEVAFVERDGARLPLVGLDDVLTGRPDPTIAPSGPAVWLAHAPGFVSDVARRPDASQLPRPGLVLSGHTHGGQVRHPWGPLVVPHGSGPFVQGWYRDAWAPLYVSRGIGWSIAPLRFLCRPELALFTLRAA